jgi:hypothetical protein
MKKMTTIKCLLALGVGVVLVAGCATHNVNPPQARSHTGYVDFHADPPAELYWEVSRFEDHSQSMERVFSEMKPPEGGFLRLAFAPGVHRLQITFLNRVISTPAKIDVEVQDGKITPVRISLAEAGAAAVETKEVGWGSTAKGRYRRPVKYNSRETTMYELSAKAEAPVGYQPKEQMPNAR